MSQFLVDALAEAAEAEFMYQYESLAPLSAKATLGIATRRTSPRALAVGVEN